MPPVSVSVSGFKTGPGGWVSCGPSGTVPAQSAEADCAEPRRRRTKGAVGHGGQQEVPCDYVAKQALHSPSREAITVHEDVYKHVRIRSDCATSLSAESLG